MHLSWNLRGRSGLGFFAMRKHGLNSLKIRSLVEWQIRQSQTLWRHKYQAQVTYETLRKKFQEAAARRISIPVEMFQRQDNEGPRIKGVSCD